MVSNITSNEISRTLQQADEAYAHLHHSKALHLYQHALELLHVQIQQAGPSAVQEQLIVQFKQVLTKAEAVKHAEHPANQQPHQQQTGSGKAGLPGQTAVQAPRPPAATAEEYEQYKAQARTLAEHAVAADGRGESAAALKLYFQLLETLNKCHNLEAVPAVKAAIMARFQVYLERAEQLRKLQQGG